MRIFKVFAVVLCSLILVSCSIGAKPDMHGPEVSREYAGKSTGYTWKKNEQAPGKSSATIVNNEAKRLSMSFVGDCVLATANGTTHRPGSLNWVADREFPSYFFEKVANILFNDDITVASCENVFTDSEIEPVKKEGEAFWFKTAVKNAQILAMGGVDVVTLENNHTRDYGKQGFDDTIRAVEVTGVKAGFNNKPVIIERNGIRVGIVCCGLWSYSQHSNAVRQVESIKPKTDIQIVYFHGGTEKIHKPDDWKVDAARKIAEAGADLVVGSHPHVLQPMEIYRGVPIVYSLGNFVYGGNRSPENRTIIFQAFFEVNDGDIKVSYNIIPCYVYTGSTNNWQPDIITNPAEKEKVLEFMHGRREEPF